MGGITKRGSSGFIPFDGGIDEYHDPIEVAKNRKLAAKDIHIEGGKLTYRPGRRLYGPTFDDVFLGVHEYIDEDGTSHLLVASNGYIYEVDGSTKTARDSGLTEESIVFNTYRGRCRYNGATTQRKITKTVSDRIGVAKPTNVPTATYGGTGLTGNYAWAYTFVIEVDGVRVWESNPSPMLQYTLSNQVATLKGDASADSRVNARYFYRTTAGGSTFKYTGRIGDNVALSTLTDSTTDANLTDLLEETHGVPAQATISEGSNDRIYSIDGNLLRWTELAYTESYLEYQQPSSFKELPNVGVGTGLKAMYNIQAARDDLYIFQNDSTHILPQADPNQPIYTLNNHKGCVQHETIVEYNNKLFFLSNKNTVEMISGGKVIDISSRNIPVSMKNITNPEYSKGALIFDKFYALSCRTDNSKLYNNMVYVCDLSTVVEVQDGLADATWFIWEINAEYLIQKSDGTLLAFDNDSKRIFEYSKSYKNDENFDSSTTEITATWRQPMFTKGMFSRIKPHLLSIKGKQVGTIGLSYYYNEKTLTSSKDITGGNISRAGTAVAGVARASLIPDISVAPVSQLIAGEMIGFGFEKIGGDDYFELVGYEFTYTLFNRV